MGKKDDDSFLDLYAKIGVGATTVGAFGALAGLITTGNIDKAVALGETFLAIGLLPALPLATIDFFDTSLKGAKGAKSFISKLKKQSERKLKQVI